MRDQLVEAIRAALAAAGDPERAVGQQRYMKSTMPYRGLTAPVLRATLRPILADPAHRITDRAEWEATVRALWDDAAYREERYAAITLTGHRAYRAWQDSDTIPLYRHLVTTGAWWDLVDPVAADRVGPILRAHPSVEGPRMREWALDPDLWVRRTAILSQLGAAARTDPVLLLDCIDPNVEDTSFWIRKAIGWALRQYARTDPSFVRQVVEGYGPRLSGLSRREALKHL